MIIDNILQEIPPESDPIEGTRKTIWNFIENIICIIWSLRYQYVVIVLISTVKIVVWFY